MHRGDGGEAGGLHVPDATPWDSSRRRCGQMSSFPCGCIRIGEVGPGGWRMMEVPGEDSLGPIRAVYSWGLERRPGGIRSCRIGEGGGVGAVVSRAG